MEIYFFFNKKSKMHLFQFLLCWPSLERFFQASPDFQHHSDLSLNIGHFKDMHKRPGQVLDYLLQTKALKCFGIFWSVFSCSIGLAQVSHTLNQSHSCRDSLTNIWFFSKIPFWPLPHKFSVSKRDWTEQQRKQSDNPQSSDGLSIICKCKNYFKS